MQGLFLFIPGHGEHPPHLSPLLQRLQIQRVGHCPLGGEVSSLQGFRKGETGVPLLSRDHLSSVEGWLYVAAARRLWSRRVVGPARVC